MVECGMGSRVSFGGMCIVDPHVTFGFTCLGLLLA